MAANEETESGERRTRPDGSAWAEAQRRVKDRNDEARKAGKAERLAEERRVAAAERAQQKRGNIFR